MHFANMDLTPRTRNSRPHLTLSPEGRVFFNRFSRLHYRDEDGNEIGEVPTTDVQNDSMYLCPVTIGEGPNAVTVNLDFDTGSSDLWGPISPSLI